MNSTMNVNIPARLRRASTFARTAGIRLHLLGPGSAVAVRPGDVFAQRDAEAALVVSAVEQSKRLRARGALLRHASALGVAITIEGTGGNVAWAPGNVVAHEDADTPLVLAAIGAAARQPDPATVGAATRPAANE